MSARDVFTDSEQSITKSALVCLSNLKIDKPSPLDLLDLDQQFESSVGADVDPGGLDDDLDDGFFFGRADSPTQTPSPPPTPIPTPAPTPTPPPLNPLPPSMMSEQETERVRPKRRLSRPARGENGDSRDESDRYDDDAAAAPAYRKPDSVVLLLIELESINKIMVFKEDEDGEDSFLDGSLGNARVGAALKAAIETLVVLAVESTLVAELMGPDRDDLRKRTSEIFSRISQIIDNNRGFYTGNMRRKLRRSPVLEEIELRLLKHARSLIFDKETWSATPLESITIANKYRSKLLEAVRDRITETFQDDPPDRVVKLRQKINRTPLEQIELLQWTSGRAIRLEQAIRDAQKSGASVVAVDRVIKYYNDLIDEDGIQ